MATTPNQAIKYKPLILEEKRVSRSAVQPYGVYRISTYKYADGNKESLSGNDTTIIFVTGIYEQKFSAIKLSSIKPEDFFKWFKKLEDKANKVLNEQKTTNVGLYDIATVYDRGGDRIYNSYVKTGIELKKIENPYRTYNKDGIQYMSEVFFKKNVLEEYYG
jgi:hypothetical protein